MAALLGHEPLALTPQAISATSGPRTDATLRERHTTVISVLARLAGGVRVSEPPTAAVMVRELGRQLAALRRAAGLTQHQVAGLTGFSRSAVSLAEIGREPHARQFWEACDKALDTGGVLTAGLDQITAVRQALQQATARAAQQAREAHALAALTAAQDQGDLTTRVTTIQSCPQCQHPVTVLTTLIPSPPSHPALLSTRKDRNAR